VVFYPGGDIEGRNTDAFGFMQNALDSQPDFFQQHASGFTATVIGAGGAARAVLYALKRMGAHEIRVTNRTLENAETLADDFGARVFEWEDREQALDSAAMLVNTTSLGMKGQPPLDLPLKNFSDDGLVYDIVYAPLMTQMLQDAEAKGCRIVTGIGMLLQQARPAFHAWFGVMPDVSDDLKKLIMS
jgi:shikimate dehydrogenase